MPGNLAWPSLWFMEVGKKNQETLGFEVSLGILQDTDFYLWRVRPIVCHNLFPLLFQKQSKYDSYLRVCARAFPGV